MSMKGEKNKKMVGVVRGFGQKRLDVEMTENRAVMMRISSRNSPRWVFLLWIFFPIVRCAFLDLATVAFRNYYTGSRSCPHNHSSNLPIPRFVAVAMPSTWKGFSKSQKVKEPPILFLLSRRSLFLVRRVCFAAALLPFYPGRSAIAARPAAFVPSRVLVSTAFCDMPTLRSQAKRGNPQHNQEELEKDGVDALQGGDGGGNTTTKKPRTQCSEATGKRQRGKNGPHLSKLLKVYKGLDDWHLPIFRKIRTYIKLQPNGTVLYPGSSRHITASLIFPKVTYVDSDLAVADFFQDERVRKWVEQHKEYTEDADVQCLLKNFDSEESLVPTASADLLISACAGIVSKPCTKYLKEGGYFLVSDAHFDAREVYLDQAAFRLVAFVDDDGTIHDSDDNLQGHFTTTKGTPITREEVEESKTKPKARRSFKLQKEGMFYLFQKISA